MSWQEIPGWFSFQQTYDQAVEEAPIQGARFLEIGCAFGRSAAYLSEKIRKSGKNIELHLVDPWEYSPGWGGEYASLVEKANGSPKTAFFRMMNNHAPEFCELYDGEMAFVHPITSVAAGTDLEGTFDMVFIDANHDYEAVLIDVGTWMNRVRPGGIMGGDDYHETEYPGVVRAVHEVFGERVETRLRDGWRHWFVRM